MYGNRDTHLTEPPRPGISPRSLMIFANAPPMLLPAPRRRPSINRLYSAPSLPSIAEGAPSSFLPGDDVPLAKRAAAAAAETGTPRSRPSALLKRDCRHEAHLHPSETQHAPPASSASDKYFPIRLITSQERRDAVNRRWSRSRATLNGWYTDLLLLKKKTKKTKEGEPPAVRGIKHFGATISHKPLSEAQAAELGPPELREAAPTPFLQALRQGLRLRGRPRPLPAPVSYRPSTESSATVHGHQDENEKDEKDEENEQKEQGEQEEQNQQDGVSSSRPLFQANTHNQNNGTPRRERTSRFIEHLDDDDDSSSASCLPDTPPLKDALDALLFADKKPAVRLRRWARKVGHVRSIRRLKASAKRQGHHQGSESQV